MESSAIDKAKETLLRSLDGLEKSEESLDGPAERVDVVVVYSMGRKTDDGGWEETMGWQATPGPQWIHAEMHRKAAQANDADWERVDPEEDDLENG